MKSISFYHKIFLLTTIQILLFCLSSLASETINNQHFPPDYSLFGGDYSQLPGSVSHESVKLFAMAANTGGSGSLSTVHTEDSSGSDLESWHKYLGYGTILMAGVTAVSSSSESFHETAAYVTAAGALSTLFTGYLAHGERFDMSEGLFSETNRHIVIGTLGAVLLTTAVAMAANDDDSSHSGLGISGGVLMTLAVIDIKW